MFKKDLNPANISDIVNRIDEYITEARGMTPEDTSEFYKFLEQYICDYFKKQNTDDLKLKKLIVELTDELYRKISFFNQRDVYTDGYFAIVINRLFWELSQKGVLAFFVLDNSLRDDHFKMTVELFKSGGFNTVLPYSINNLEYSENYSGLLTVSYKEVEKQIDDSRASKRHIFYVEKDESVNYLTDVLALAEEFQDKYVCIFRNSAPDSNKTATWLMGSFGDYLTMP